MWPLVAALGTHAGVVSVCVSVCHPVPIVYPPCRNERNRVLVILRAVFEHLDLQNKALSGYSVNFKMKQSIWAASSEKISKSYCNVFF